jgi:hypothetical protein
MKSINTLLFASVSAASVVLGACGSAAPSADSNDAGTMSVPATTDAGAANVDAAPSIPDEAAEASSGDAPPVEAGDEQTSDAFGAEPDAFDAATDAAADAPACSPFVINVTSVAYGPGAGFGQNAFPSIVEGPPSGAGCCQGSLGVLSLGQGGSIVVEMGETIVDGPGPDFIVFENPFNIGNDPNRPFAEPGTVEVSADGSTWAAFPCTATSFPYGTCAGWHPVYANPATNSIDPLDPTVAGGDAFDLADLADAGVTEARFVRITDRADLPGDFDLDAVAVVHGRCP